VCRVVACRVVERRSVVEACTVVSVHKLHLETTNNLRSYELKTFNFNYRYFASPPAGPQVAIHTDNLFTAALAAVLSSCAATVEPSLLRGTALHRTGQSWASNDALSKALAPTRVPQHLASRTPDYWAPTHTFWTLDFGVLSLNLDMSACIWSVCVYYCRTYDKVVCGGGEGQ